MEIKLKYSIYFLLILFTLIFFSLFILITSTQIAMECYSCDSCWCEGNVSICEQGTTLTCCEVRGGQCVRWGYIDCQTVQKNCNENDKWICGCNNYRSDKYRCFEDWYCSNGQCIYTFIPYSCGNSEDSDGDNINTKGNAIDRYCENGECKEKTYTDYCAGICSRSELIEYYVENDRVKNKTYSELFSQNRYCKNGKVYIDSNNPSVSIYPISSGWGRDNIRVSISCSDGDESGCYKYNYNLRKIV